MPEAQRPWSKLRELNICIACLIRRCVRRASSTGSDPECSTNQDSVTRVTSAWIAQIDTPAAAGFARSWMRGEPVLPKSNAVASCPNRVSRDRFEVSPVPHPASSALSGGIADGASTSSTRRCGTECPSRGRVRAEAVDERQKNGDRVNGSAADVLHVSRRGRETRPSERARRQVPGGIADRVAACPAT